MAKRVNDRVSGDRGSDTLSGGAGLDTFIFVNKFGLDTITDFEAADDTIQFAKKMFKDYAEVQTAWSQDGADVLIDAGAGNVVRIQHTLLTELSQADFLFV
jgi:Ca2+-binding RTX toxin-like protein